DDPETALTNQRSESGALSTFYASDGLTLLSNGERIFPADYNDADVDHHLPLTELNLSDHLKTGTTTICIVWPDPGGNTITLDHPEGKYSTPNTAYRLTDIPIKNS
ncbi:flagellar motor protein MotB, partial [Actinomyces oris]